MTKYVSAATTREYLYNERVLQSLVHVLHELAIIYDFYSISWFQNYSTVKPTEQPQPHNVRYKVHTAMYTTAVIVK